MSLGQEYKSVKIPYPMFKDMASILEDRKGENFALKKFTVTEEDVLKVKRNDWYGEYTDFVPGEYMKLVDLNSVFQDVIMSDTPMERKTNLDLYSKANGHVLIAGLGIGMVLLAIQDKPEVTKITVVEKYQEVIDMVAPQLPLNEKVEIVQSDIFDYKPARGLRFDTIYMDIWTNIIGDDYEEHLSLERKFKRRLNNENPEAWFGSWRKKDFKHMAKRRFF